MSTGWSSSSSLWIMALPLEALEDNLTFFIVIKVKKNVKRNIEEKVEGCVNENGNEDKCVEKIKV